MLREASNVILASIKDLDSSKTMIMTGSEAGFHMSFKSSGQMPLLVQS